MTDKEFGTADGRLAMHCATTTTAPLQCDPAGRIRMIEYLKQMNAPPALLTLQEAAGSSVPLYVERAQLVADEGVVEDDEPVPTPPPRRYPQPRERYGYPPPAYGPPPGTLIEPWTGRTIPCALTILTFGALPVCI